MKFQEVVDLVPGTKYRILCHDIITFTGFYSHTDEMFYTFQSVQGDHFHKKLQFSQLCNTFHVPHFQKECIQSAMEHRAVNLILRNIIGDPSFTWQNLRFRTSLEPSRFTG